MPKETEYDTINCPECKAEQVDLDGFGFMYCERCRFCIHPACDGDICRACGKVVVVDG